jgi:biopolymer transport protein ExbB
MNQGLVGSLIALPVFEAEWVLWLLVSLSIASVAIILERFFFLRAHRVDVDTVRTRLTGLLDAADYKGAAAYLRDFDSLETNVVLRGLEAHAKGPEAVSELVSGHAKKERLRYDRRLSFLATVGSNAPFIGLFGTVLGIIKAFRDLAGNMAEASSSVMAGISEALVATAVGLMVAIPAVIAYNYFKGRVQHVFINTQLLSSILLANLKATPPRA